MAPVTELVAIFGPTAIGKTAVAVALAERLRERGENPVAISCDAIQVYRGLETISGAPGAAERRALEHRLVGIADPGEEFSAAKRRSPGLRSTSCSGRVADRSSSVAPGYTCGRC